MIRINDERLLYELYEKYDVANYFLVDRRELMHLVKFEKDEIIQNFGDTNDELYIMVGGSAKVNSIQENGKAKLICIVKDFDIMGYIEFFANMNYSNEIVSLKETYCLVLNLRENKEIILSDPIFTKYMIESMAKMVLSNNIASSFNLLNSLERRLATYILLSANENYFNENLTSLSELLAVSYRHLHRVLMGLCEKDILLKKGKFYKIIDKKSLEDLADKSIRKF